MATVKNPPNDRPLIYENRGINASSACQCYERLLYSRNTDDDASQHKQEDLRMSESKLSKQPDLIRRHAQLNEAAERDGNARFPRIPRATHYLWVRMVDQKIIALRKLPKWLSDAHVKVMASTAQSVCRRPRLGSPSTGELLNTGDAGRACQNSGGSPRRCAA